MKSRRSFLRGAAGVAVALPFLSSLARTARAAPAPKRILLVYSGNGTVTEGWQPTGGEMDFVLSNILSPLEPYRDYLMVLDGVDNKAGQNSQGGGHQAGLGSLWTGTELTTDDLFMSGNGGYAGWGGGISVDQFIADQTHAETQTKFKSIELGVQVGKNADVNTRMVYLGASQPVPAQDDPKKAFDLLFKDLSADPDTLAKLRAERKTVLDAVVSDIAEVKGRLDAADTMRLDHHLTAVEEVEKQILATGNQVGGECKVPADPTGIDAYATKNFPQVGQIQMDLLHMAFACDLTRVASLQWAKAVNNVVHSWADPSISEGHHTLSHEPIENAVAKAKLIKINQWYAKQIAYLCEKLKNTPEGDGNMLDNTMIVWGNELGVGQTHSRKRIPFVTVGNSGGYFKTGRYLKFTSASHNKLLVSLCRGMGVDVNTFGNADYGTGEMTELRA